MKKEILISNLGDGTRIAILWDNRLYELYLESGNDIFSVGNVFKGRVSRVLPGMQAAFVDIGMDRDAFLYIRDIDAAYVHGQDLAEFANGNNIPLTNSGNQPIEDLLRRGQEILVQVIRENVEQKGPRVTTQISFPGRFLVLLPSAKYLGVSKKIKDDEERQRLRSIVLGLQKSDLGGYGLIVRTNADGVAEEQLADEYARLRSKWLRVLSHGENRRSPALIHRDEGVEFRIIRDNLNDSVDKIYVDSQPIFDRLSENLQIFAPESLNKLELTEENPSLFERFGVEKEIEKNLKPRVWLKSGGHLVINQTEALVAIDVNTGKYTGGKNLEDTVLKINIEAVREIVRQLILRDLGGIIVIDLIDMELAENRQQVLTALEKELQYDRSYSRFLQLSEFGLLQLTRKRSRLSLERMLTSLCPYCSGNGRIRSTEAISRQIYRDLCAQLKKRYRPLDCTVLIVAHPLVTGYLQNDGRELLDLITASLESLTLRKDESFHQEHYDILFRE